MPTFSRTIVACLVVFAACFLSQPAAAHPHAFVDAQVAIVLDDQGLAGFRQRWLLDEMTTVAVLDLIGAYGAGNLTPEMVAAIEAQSMGSLKEFGYFTDIRINGRRFHIQWVKDFDASLDGARLVYEFFVPCHVKAAPGPKEVKIAVYDDSFYSYVNYASGEDSGVNPMLDPGFADTGAPARPGDFQRFSRAVGLGGHAGAAKLEGPVESFHIETDVQDAPEMIYFYEQIVPEAFIIRFNRS